MIEFLSRHSDRSENLLCVLRNLCFFVEVKPTLQYCFEKNRFFGLSDLRMTKNIYRHTEALAEEASLKDSNILKKLDSETSSG